jgi:hypothetical protein
VKFLPPLYKDLKLLQDLTEGVADGDEGVHKLLHIFGDVPKDIFEPIFEGPTTLLNAFQAGYICLDLFKRRKNTKTQLEKEIFIPAIDPFSGRETDHVSPSCSSQVP